MLGRSILARILAAQGKVAEAAGELKHVRGMVREGISPYFVVNPWDVEDHLLVAEALVLARSEPGRLGRARAALRTRIAQVGREGGARRAFELRLGLGEAEAAARAPGAAGRLAALESDARAKGFLFIARRAAETRAALK
jgi:hypothetical protein